MVDEPTGTSNLSECQDTKESFFELSNKTDEDGQKLRKFNTDFWNESIVETTCYQVADLRRCLHKLCSFVSENLSPDRLKGFDLDALLDK